MQRRTILILSGYDEPPEHLETLADGRKGIPGLRAYGFECVFLPRCYEQLGERIERLAECVEQLRSAGYPFPITLLGYSLGGLVARGYLRAYPQRAIGIEATIMIGTPNFGVMTHVLPYVTAFLQVPDHAIGDLTLGSDFLTWLNGTSGHWQVDPRTHHHVWRLDREPTLGPERTRSYVIAGLCTTRGGTGDGVVGGDSASLGSRFPTHYIIGPNCNHMNLVGHFDPLVFMWTGFLVTNGVWPQTLRAILRFAGAKPLVPANV